jgi:PAS domain S-box-containing protein/putative nucleotidyltransferase with HDIG domain
MQIKNKIHILIIEDNPGDVRITQVMLQGDPYCDCSFVVCDHLQAALEYLAANSPDIALLDLNLPDSHGLSTFLTLQEKYPFLPVVIMSGNNDLDAASEAVRHGAQDYLVKSTVERDDLSRAIRYAIERKQTEIDLAREKAELGALIYSIADAIIAVDTDCQITRMNPVAEKITGWKESEALGKEVTDVFIIAGDVRYDKTNCPIRHILESEIVSTQSEPLFLINRSGERIAVSNSIAVVKDTRGHATGAVLVFHDDTHQRIAQSLLETRLALIAFAADHSLDELLTEALDRVSELADSPVGFYHFLDEDQQTLTLQAWSTKTKETLCKAEGMGLHYNIAQAGVWVDCVRERRIVVHNDYASLPHKKGMPEGHVPLVREVVVPVMRSGSIVAIMGVGNKAQNYSEYDEEIVSYLADVTWEIIRQKQAEEELQRSEEQYRQIVETAREGMWIIQADDTISFVNQELADMLGYAKEEIIGTNSLHYVLQEDRTLLQEKIENHRKGIQESYEFRILRSDGKPLWALLSATPNYDEKGHYNGALVMVTDITQRKQVEQIMVQERDRAQKYFDIAGVILLVLDKDGIIEAINEKGIQILGYENAGELIGLDWFNTFVPADIRDDQRSKHHKLIKHSEDVSEYVESQILTRTGAERHIAWHHTTIRDAERKGNIARLSSGEDITERIHMAKQREMLLELTRQAASASDFSQLLFFIAEQLVKIIPSADSASIFMVDREKGTAVIKAWAGFAKEDLTALEIPLSESVTGRVIADKKPVHIANPSEDPHFVQLESENSAVIRSTIAAPIIFRDGETAGVIFCDSRDQARGFNDGDLVLLETVSRQLAGVIENLRLLDQLNAQHTELQISESRYRDLFNTISNGFALHEMIYDDNGKPVDYRFLEVNSAFCKMIGLQCETIIGRTVLEVLPETEPYWIEAYAKVVKTGKPLHMENFAKNLNKSFEVIAFSPAKGQFATVISDITERKNFITALQAERDKAQNYLDIAEVMIVALDVNGIITLANRKSCEILGYREKDLIGSNWFSLCVPEYDRKRSWDLYANFIDSDETSGPDYEQTFVTKKGKERKAAWDSHKLLNTDGRVVGILSSGADITERKKADEALKQYERIVSSSSDMLALINTDLVYASANSAYGSAFGLSPQKMIGRNSRDLISAEFFDAVIKPHMMRCFQGEEDAFSAWFEIPKIGRRYMETHYFPYFGTQGEVLGLVANHRDITEQYRIQQALQENEERLSDIINNSTNVFYAYDCNHRITFISPQCEDLFGFTPDEMKIKWTTLVTDNPINSEGVALIAKAISTGKMQSPYELEMRTKGSRNVWVEVHEAPVLENSKVIGMVGSLTDITSRRRAELENQQSMAALKIVNEDLRSARDRIQGTMEATIRTIAKTVEVRDPYTAGHHRRVADLAQLIAEEMGLDDELVKAIELAAVIHDLGKIQVPAEILSKPGKLTEIEFGLVKTHPEVGYQLLKDIDFPWPLAEIIHQHHERMDGSGYPRGLKGELITLESRIIGVADTVEAMSSHRPYRAALGVERALDQIRQDRGTLYDAEVVDACLSIFARGYEMPLDD